MGKPTAKEIANGLYSASVVSTAWQALMIDAANTITDLQSKLEAISTKYHDLTFQVSSKHPYESRHETAKRYILEAEISGYDCESTSPILEKDDG